MGKLIILGSSNAIPDPRHENTHMVFTGDKRTVLVDCVSNPVLRLQQAGIDFIDSLTDIILTHFHPDHVSGLPLLLMNMWLLGRKHPLNIYGLHYTLDRMEDLMRSYAWSEWPDFFPVVFYRLPEDERTQVMESEEYLVHASPVKHLIPAIGLRVEHRPSHRVVAYSCDTGPCDEVVRLAEAADVLLHEAGGAIPGHTSAQQAGEIAGRAGVRELILIHYPTGKYASGDPLAEAQKAFHGPVRLAQDFMVIELG